jgi:hypothetical protein
MAFRAMGLSQGEKLVLLVLADHADEHLECWPSKERLAAHTGMSVRSIYSALRGLQDRQMLTLERRTRTDGTRSTNLYRLHLVAPPSANTAYGDHRQKSTRTIGKNRHQPSATVAEQNLPIEPRKINLAPARAPRGASGAIQQPETLGNSMDRLIAYMATVQETEDAPADL